MKARGWQVSSVCSAGPFVDALRRQGYRIETIEIARSMNPLSALRSLFALIRLFRLERYDVLHVHTPVAALIGRFAAFLTGIPLVIYTAHGFYFHDGMPKWKYRLFVTIERCAGYLTDLLFTQSDEDAQSAVSEQIMPPGRVQAIGNGVDVSRFDPNHYLDSRQKQRNASGIPSDAYVVGLIGRQVREKGVVDFLLAAQRLAVTHPHIWFLLVGEKLASDHAAGVGKEFARAQAVLGERLVASGLRSDIPEMLNAMDLFCLPSWREGMPRTIIEAMMMAKPVLATDIRGSREEVVHELTGLLVPVHSPELLAQAIGRFADNSAWGVTLGAAGRERALRLYDERKVVATQLERIEREAELRGIR